MGQVRTVARRPLPSALPNPHKLVHTQADLREPSAHRALAGVDLLYHLGAQVWLGRAKFSLFSPAAGPSGYGANVDGTRNVLQARPGAVVFASSAAVYGAWPDNPLPIDEAHEPRPNVECPYAMQKLVAEQAVVAEVPRNVVVRLTAVLGPHADARVARAVHAYRVAVPAISGVTQALQWLDEDDAAEGLLAAGRTLLRHGPAPDIAGTVLNLAPADWLGAKEVAALARSRVLTLPRGLVVNGADLGRQLGLSPFGADRAVFLSGPLALSATRATEQLGWRPTRTSAEVLRAAMGASWERLPRNRAQN